MTPDDIQHYDQHIFATLDDLTQDEIMKICSSSIQIVSQKLRRLYFEKTISSTLKKAANIMGLETPNIPVIVAGYGLK